MTRLNAPRAFGGGQRVAVVDGRCAEPTAEIGCRSFLSRRSLMLKTDFSASSITFSTVSPSLYASVAIWFAAVNMRRRMEAASTMRPYASAWSEVGTWLTSAVRYAGPPI